MMAPSAQYVEKTDSAGRITERGHYQHNHKIGKFEFIDYDRHIIMVVHYTDTGDEKIQDSYMYGMVQDTIGNCIHRGDLRQSAHTNDNGTVTIKEYLYRPGCRIPQVTATTFQTENPRPNRSRRVR